MLTRLTGQSQSFRRFQIPKKVVKWQFYYKFGKFRVEKGSFLFVPKLLHLDILRLCIGFPLKACVVQGAFLVLFLDLVHALARVFLNKEGFALIIER